MSMDYTADAADVFAALQEAGMAMTLRKQTAGVYNPATGEYDTQTITDYTVQGLIKSQSLTNVGNVGQRFNGQEIQTDDQFVMLAASGLTAAPAPGDLLIISGVAYSVKTLIPLQPGGVTLLYQLLVRK
jgi:hypothetical protein